MEKSLKVILILVLAVIIIFVLFVGSFILLPLVVPNQQQSPEWIAGSNFLSPSASEIKEVYNKTKLQTTIDFPRYYEDNNYTIQLSKYSFPTDFQIILNVVQDEGYAGNSTITTTTEPILIDQGVNKEKLLLTPGIDCLLVKNDSSFTLEKIVCNNN